MSNFKNLLKALKDDRLLVTPTVLHNLARGAEFVLDEKHAGILFDQTTAQPRVRHGSFSSSSRGQCERRQVLSYLQSAQTRTIDTKLQLIFLDGQWRHLRWQAMLLQWGVVDVIEYAFESPLYMLKGSLDAANTKQGWGFELKGCNEHTFKEVSKFGPLHNHVLQIHTYMLGTGFDTFSLVYENKNTQEFKEFVIDRDVHIAQQVEDELERLQQAVENEELPEVIDACQEVTDYSCPYRDQCHAATWEALAP